MVTVELNEAGLAGLRIKTDKVNKRADRHGMNKLNVTVLRKYVKVHCETGAEEIWYSVEIDGRAPCIDGWNLVAVIENNDAVGTIVRVVPGPFEDCDYSEYREHDYTCDHCNTRRYRKDVFVLRKDNDVKVVGRNCLADFIRTGDAESYARYAEYLNEVSSWDNDNLSDAAYSEGFGERGGRPVISLERFLSVVQCCTRRLGWTSRTEARDAGYTATADNAYYVLFGRGNGHTKFIQENELYVSEADKDLAAKAIEWAKSVEPGKSEYLNTINIIAIAGQTDERLSGYAGSIIRAYQKDQEFKAERAEREANQPSKDYIGSVGQRLKGLTVTVKRVRYYENDWGTKTIVAMEARLPNGSVAPMTWFASGSKEFDEGVNYVFAGTVKDHKDDERFGKQTIVNRCKLEEV